MAPAESLNPHNLTIALLVSLTLLWVGPLSAEETPVLSDYAIAQFGEPPAISEGPLPEDLATAMQVALVDSPVESKWGDEQLAALDQIAASGDPRIAWIISDMMRFVTGWELHLRLGDVAATLLGIETDGQNDWGTITDHLIAWNIPAPPDYLEAKRAIFTSVIPGWDGIFVEGGIDWRLVSWGGVLVDDRAYDTTDRMRNCIPAADNPEVSSAVEPVYD